MSLLARHKKPQPPLGFSGEELDHIFDFLLLLEVINFVQHDFLAPSMLSDSDLIFGERF